MVFTIVITDGVTMLAEKSFALPQQQAQMQGYLAGVAALFPTHKYLRIEIGETR